jgi:acyl-CoA reductase-like NAD-dependent aldehyde dehydrogenase
MNPPQQTKKKRFGAVHEPYSLLHSSMTRARLKVLKTYKLYIGGKFPRTESGRTMTAQHATTGEHLAHYCHASRKDLRDAVVAARSAQPGWSATTAYLRGQILYRAAEVIEGRAGSFASELAELTGQSVKEAGSEVDAAIDRLVSCAGWTDKYSQVFSSVNPVASPHFNFTFPEPTGVVGIFAPDAPAFLALVSLIAQVILSGNTAVVLASETAPLPAISLGEVLATSDLPGGVVNLLTGRRAELAPWLAGHMDVNAIIEASGDTAILATLQAGTGDNLKRVHSHSLAAPGDWFTDAGCDPYRILDTVEFKTAWHPMGV